jgi:gamma-glutamyl-gamma-aminobutyraldehyde dehydrogenase
MQDEERFEMKNFPSQAFIGGELMDAASGATFDSLAPGSGELLAKVAACDAEDVDRAVGAARRAFDSGVWAEAAPADRKKVLLGFAELIEANAAELAYLDAVDAGKPITDCEELDIPDVITYVRWYAEAIDKIFGKISPTGPGAVGLIDREPIGVVGAVLPWNFPAAMVSWKVGPALASGCSVVIKPPEQAPLSTIRIAELAAAAGVPDGVLNVVPGLGEVAGRALGLHRDVDAITFTGSVEVGREFLRYSADSNLKRVVLELGGKSPQIVLGDASRSLDNVVEELAGAAFWNAGQNCTAGSRILVQRGLHDPLVEALAAASAEWTVGDPLDRATKLGPLIEPAAMDRVLGYIEGAKEGGARIAAGGHRVREESGGWFVAPTVIDDVTPEMPVAREEIFGPVTSVVSFDTEEDALRIANDSSYGLQASIFTHDLDTAHRFARKVRAGTVTVNCYGEGDVTTPFGGYKQSGFGGRDNGLEAFDQYTELKTTWIALG